MDARWEKSTGQWGEKGRRHSLTKDVSHLAEHTQPSTSPPADLCAHLLPVIYAHVPLWVKTDFNLETLVSIIHAL